MIPVRVALIGFGEVGQALAGPLGNGRALRIYDRLFDAVAAPLPDQGCRTAVAAVAGADLVISAVTAAQTAIVARAVAPHLAVGAWYMDLNSASPSQKIAAAEAVDGAGGRYVEVSVMSPIHPKGMASPLLLGGPHAEAFVPVAQALGFSGACFHSAVPGRAAATKLCRSVLVKGMEALVIEAFLAARHYGVEDTILASLGNVLPHPDWPGHARYMMSRALRHGVRRAEEMEEAAATVAASGLAPGMAAATAQVQRWAARFGDAADSPDLATMLDAVRQELTP
ncbi:NAD(P)-dependent oxidoreductase [Nitrospirillum iridis]|uniref:3-hydroxyisobutyrate dehydrogenase-like beta-hydroxyacid dehydrogenase n=1 Tax=Nitrospirillum iridis TaxID=765888 RepID=A0A7X0B0W6_9PROT|nr:NAD(P)-dependent oxidoreductase [Nitrospirillum iridis]MBB6252129.1 3-hydroxyisobutyrate dehydrogenase-like beta-hydroxyacid dehydrogenase [Nitrospirillum iridis]